MIIGSLVHSIYSDFSIGSDDYRRESKLEFFGSGKFKNQKEVITSNRVDIEKPILYLAWNVKRFASLPSQPQHTRSSS